jgi:hypothetical protein
MGHNESKRARAKGLYQRGVLGIELTGPVDDRGVLFLRVIRQLFDRLRRNLVRLLG